MTSCVEFLWYLGYMVYGERFQIFSPHAELFLFGESIHAQWGVTVIALHTQDLSDRWMSPFSKYCMKFV